MIRILLVLAALLNACGTPPDHQPNFFVVVKNTTSSPDDVTIRTAVGGEYLTELKQRVPANGEAVWVLSKGRPDLVEIESSAVTTGWGPPDWAGHMGWVITYPTGAAQGQDWPPRSE